MIEYDDEELVNRAEWYEFQDEKAELLARLAKGRAAEEENLAYAIMEVKSKGTVIDLLSQIGNLDKEKHDLQQQIKFRESNCKVCKRAAEELVENLKQEFAKGYFLFDKTVNTMNGIADILAEYEKVKK
jgi:hypothetical protein